MKGSEKVKLESEINKEKIKLSRKRYFKNIYYKVVGLTIVKPYIFIENYLNEISKIRMNKNVPKFKRKVANEIINYAQFLLTRCGDNITISKGRLGSYYNDYEADIRIDQFVGYGFSPRKFNRISRKFYDYVLRGNKEKDKIYSEILTMVLDHFRKYEDVEIIKKERSSKDYWVIKIK